MVFLIFPSMTQEWSWKTIVLARSEPYIWIGKVVLDPPSLRGSPEGQKNLFSYRSWGQKSKISFSGLKSGCQLGWFLLEALRKNSFSYTLQLLESAYVAWFVAPSSTVKVHHFNLCFHITSPSLLTLTPSSFSDKDYYDYIWAHPANSG